MTDDEARAVVGRIQWAEYEPGYPEGDSLSHPGVVVICCELPKRVVEEYRFSILALRNVNHDALDMAKSLLKQQWKCNSRLFARIAVIPEQSDRALAYQALDLIRKKGIG